MQEQPKQEMQQPMMQKQAPTEITKDTLIGDIPRYFPQAVETLLGYGVHCIGCHVSEFETVEQGLKGHGITDEVVKEAIVKLNEAIKTPQTKSSSESITLTDAAVQKIKSLIEEKENVSALKISVPPGGCSRFEYHFSLVNEQESEDKVIEQKGVKVFIPQATLDMIKGSEIDYKDSLQDAGFKIQNPNATSTCGCGSSFS